MAPEDGTQTNPTDTQGTPANPNVENPTENISELDKLKAHNAELKKELLEGQSMSLEIKKLQAEKILGGEVGGNVDPTPKEETPKEYKDRIDKEISEGKHND